MYRSHRALCPVNPVRVARGESPIPLCHSTWLTGHLPLLTVCPNSLKNGDPLCLNGGRLHSDNSSGTGNEYYTNCAFCDCPQGWGGVDCSRESRTTRVRSAAMPAHMHLNL